MIPNLSLKMIEDMYKKGIGFTVSMSPGFADLDPSQVFEYLNAADPDQWLYDFKHSDEEDHQINKH